MPWNFSSDKPIFQQLVDRITLDIIRKRYQPGQKLEAVRELSVIAGVNPNTMQRALSAIEESGLIYTKRGDGRYVTDDPQVIKQAENEYVTELVSDFYGKLNAIGLNHEEIMQAVESAGKDV